MKVKIQGVINNMSLRKDGEYRIEFKFALFEIAKVISMVKLLNNNFSIGVISEEKDKAIITNAYFYKLSIDREGESKLSLSFSFEHIDNDSLAFFGKHQEELVKIFIKNGEESE